MPFFGGTIIFVPKEADRPAIEAGRSSSTFVLPSAVPTPAPTPPPESRTELELKCHVRARIPTPHGHVFLHLYKTNQDAKEHMAIVFDPAQMDDGVWRKEHIRSRSLDESWKAGETDMERMIRGAYVGRLTEHGGTASLPPAEAAAQASTSGETPATAASSSSSSSSGSSSPAAAGPRTHLAPLIRIHSECFTGETIGSHRCDCGEQLDEALRLISLPTRSPTDPSSYVPGRGAIVYLRQEGRGIGLLSKLLAYNLQDLGHDTVSANIALGHGADERKWDIAGAILRDLGLGEDEQERGVRMLTNNPDKVEGMKSEGIKVIERVGMIPRSWESYPHAKDNGFPATPSNEYPHTDTPPLSEALDGQLHPDVKEREREHAQWLARKSGVGMIGGAETRSEELDRYLKTKIERMGHLLSLPPGGARES
jgi:GTP cyclohydrolase II